MDKDKGVIPCANGSLTHASEGTILLTNLDPNQFGRGKESEEKEQTEERGKVWDF